MKKVLINKKDRKVQNNAELEEARLSAIIKKGVKKVVTEHREVLEKLGNE